MSSPPAFTNDDIERILRVVDRLADIELRIESGDLKLHVRKVSGSAVSRISTDSAISSPAEIGRETSPVAPKRADSAKKRASIDVPAEMVAVRAPVLGTFYRASSPSEPPFVEVGSHVSVDDTVCIIEVMKLFNTVNAGVKGTVEAIAVENGTMVEFDQVLFLIRPD